MHLIIREAAKMVSEDSYSQKVIKKGDEISSELERVFSPTVSNSNLVEIVSAGMNGIKVIRLPTNSAAFVWSLGGDPSLLNPKDYADSVVERLIKIGDELDITPVSFTNVIDARCADPKMVLPFAEALAEKANEFKLAVTNGEFAVLGERLSVAANISATMLGFLPLGNQQKIESGHFEIKGVRYAFFDPEGKALYMNSDGVGSKTEFYERNGDYWKAKIDSKAMKLDDLIKLGATAKVVSDVWETNDLGFEALWGLMEGLTSRSDRTKVIYLAQLENVRGRLVSYKPDQVAFNVSGSAISTLDEERLQNPLAPCEGDYLVAIRAKPNQRSNGITDKRKIMVDLFGNDWHHTAEGKLFMQYLGEPSFVLYNLFKELIDQNLATSVYHLSGGAFKGKLAKPLAKHHLFVEIENIFNPDWRELTLCGARFTNAETAYSKWPMGNDGFVTTSNPNQTLEEIQNYNLRDNDLNQLEARVVGQLERRVDGKTGIQFKAYSGEQIYFSGI